MVVQTHNLILTLLLLLSTEPTELTELSGSVPTEPELTKFGRSRHRSLPLSFGHIKDCVLRKRIDWSHRKTVNYDATVTNPSSSSSSSSYVRKVRSHSTMCPPIQNAKIHQICRFHSMVLVIRLATWWKMLRELNTRSFLLLKFFFQRKLFSLINALTLKTFEHIKSKLVVLYILELRINKLRGAKCPSHLNLRFFFDSYISELLIRKSKTYCTIVFFS